MSGIYSASVPRSLRCRVLYDLARMAVASIQTYGELGARNCSPNMIAAMAFVLDESGVLGAADVNETPKTKSRRTADG